MAERLALPTSDHGVAGSNPAGGEILPEPKRRFIAQSLLCSPFHRLEMTEILFKGRKTLTHPSIVLRNSNIIYERCRPIQKRDLGVFSFTEHIRKLTIEFLCLFEIRLSNTLSILPFQGWNTLGVFFLTIDVL